MSKTLLRLIHARMLSHKRSGLSGSCGSAGQSAVPGISTMTQAHPRLMNSLVRWVLSVRYPSRPVIRSTVGTRCWGLAFDGIRVYTGIIGLSAPEAAECGMLSSTIGSIQPRTAFAYASFCASQALHFRSELMIGKREMRYRAAIRK